MRWLHPEGRLRVFGSSAAGREIAYGTYGAGEYIGEMSLDGGPGSASVEAIEPVECVQVTRHTLLKHIAEHPEFALELIDRVIRSARAATLSTKQLALNDAYGRLVLLLNSLAVAQPDGTRLIGERLTHQEIANRLGCSREMVSRLMKDLEGVGTSARPRLATRCASLCRHAGSGSSSRVCQLRSWRHNLAAHAASIVGR